jgi:hypothetical protein
MLPYYSSSLLLRENALNYSVNRNSNPWTFDLAVYLIDSAQKQPPHQAHHLGSPVATEGRVSLIHQYSRSAISVT